MISQKIYLILLIMQIKRDGADLISYIKENIDIDIKEFLPPGIEFIGCELSTDFYADEIIDRIYFTNHPILPDKLSVKKGVMELTFSSDANIQFKRLPWFERYISESIEYYDDAGLIFPYLIRDGEGYTFRVAYRIVMLDVDKNGMTQEIEDDYFILENNADFFKHQFYKEEVPDKCMAQLAKTMLIKAVRQK